MISLFSGTQIPYCERYVKKGGLILTGSFFSDYASASGEKELELLCSIRCDKGKAQIYPDGEPPKGPSRSRLKKEPGGFSYQDDETYFLYRKKS